MGPTNIVREMATLPPEAQKEVIDFMAFLKTRHLSRPANKKAKRSKLAQDPFIGMWRTRKEMRDSTAWVRSQREWKRCP